MIQVVNLQAQHRLARVGRISIDLQGLGGFYINISFGLDGLGRVSIDL